MFLFLSCVKETHRPPLDHHALAARYFHEDAQWYLENIPFFECSDSAIEQVYYYRWKMYKAHVRNVGTNEYVITEFINHMPWDREPYCTINAASMHHIYEGRWLRDSRYINGYINNLYRDGGNNLQYSESIADASFANYLVTGDAAFITSYLDSMKAKYEGWKDHWDAAKNLYYIPAMPDATEYTVASIDASGGTGGFDDGEAFRPTLNSYMYGNARAIARIAELKGDLATRDEYAGRAASLKANVQASLWNDAQHHFMDRFKVNNQYVHYWDFIRNRELAGMIPWYFDLPDDEKKYNAAWKNVLDTTILLGRYGLRTNEPAYEYYFKQIAFTWGLPSSQWNGPSWPYQSSQTLTGMANLLNNYRQTDVTATDYLKLLRLYTHQHYLPDGKLNLVENYDPNKGKPIVFYYWSNHYNHSSYNNLIISGLCGIRPAEGDTLTLNPLIDNSIQYFCLSNLRYHGHDLTVVFDRDGNKYHMGKGLTVFVDGREVDVKQLENKYQVNVGKIVVPTPLPEPTNYAFNIRKKGFPEVSASVNALKDSVYQAVDGKVWYFPEVSNRWSTIGSDSEYDWIAINFGEEREVSSVKIYPLVYGDFILPYSVSVDYWTDGEWNHAQLSEEPKLTGNTENTLRFNKVKTAQIRVNFIHNVKHVAISEVECY